MLDFIIYSLINVCLLIIFSYFISYRKKKGENQATKEDIGKITREIEEVKKQYSKDIEILRKDLQLTLLTKGQFFIDRINSIKEFYNTIIFQRKFTVNFPVITPNELNPENLYTKYVKPLYDSSLDMYGKTFVLKLYVNDPVIRSLIVDVIDNISKISKIYRKYVTALLEKSEELYKIGKSNNWEISEEDLSVLMKEKENFRSEFMKEREKYNNEIDTGDNELLEKLRKYIQNTD